MKRALLSSFILLASCSSASPNAVPVAGIGAAFATPNSSGHGYKLLYSFKGMPDGAWPIANLTAFNGVLYGVTEWGGQTAPSGEQTGTIFKITPDGKEQVVYTFKGYPDADSPRTAPIVVKGALYGTTPFGGYRNFGTIYTLTAAGKLTVLYRFAGGIKGQQPYGGLVYVNGLFYGAAYVGGATYNGLLYSFSLSGKYHVLYSFRGGPDGSYPYSNLTYADGKLWGTTAGASSETHGTIFSCTLNGKETPIYEFKGAPDGEYPGVGLIKVNNLFYGTTGSGGSHQGGTFYSVDANGNEKVLYSFPYYGGPVGVTYINGAMYGATYRGGKGIPGHGTIYKMSLAGQKSALYQFTGSTNAKLPIGQLTEFNGRLYGLTTKGGQYNWGAVYSIQP